MLGEETELERPPAAADYKVLNRIGQGAFGEVLQAVHRPSGQVRALKRVFNRKPQLGLADTTLREYQSLRSLQHCNIVRLLDTFAQNNTLVLVLEYCCTDLAEIIQHSWHPLSEEVLKSLFQQILTGLAACHEAGILHRDVKPANILLSQDGVVKLADFGHARPNNGGDRPQYSHAVATRWYRAPELLYGARAYGQAVDIWSAGCILAELLGLCPLVAGETDIEQLGRVIATFGSIEDAWPGVKELPDYGKISFAACQGYPLEELLPDSSPGSVKLLKRLLKLDPGRLYWSLLTRALTDDWFLSDPKPATQATMRAVVEQTLAAKQTRFKAVS
ncbi:Cyclin-dependent kinase 20 [Trebouxia sp. C0010 RCD-2024]